GTALQIFRQLPSSNARQSDSRWPMTPSQRAHGRPVRNGGSKVRPIFLFCTVPASFLSKRFVGGFNKTLFVNCAVLEPVPENVEHMIGDVSTLVPSGVENKSLPLTR